MYPQIFFGNPDTTIPNLVAFWAVFYFWVGAEWFIAYRFRPRLGTKVSDAGSMWILISLVWAGVAVGFVLGAVFPAAAFTSGRRLLFYTGIALMLLGLALRWYSIRVLGQSFTSSVAVRPGQQVVDVGPYRWIRHPSYTGGLISVLGVLVCLTNPLSFLGLPVSIAGYAYRIRVEERVLLKNLGEPYRSYMKRTKRLVPFLV